MSSKITKKKTENTHSHSHSHWHSHVWRTKATNCNFSDFQFLVVIAHWFTFVMVFQMIGNHPLCESRYCRARSLIRILACVRKFLLLFYKNASYRLHTVYINITIHFIFSIVVVVTVVVVFVHNSAKFAYKRDQNFIYRLLIGRSKIAC